MKLNFAYFWQAKFNYSNFIIMKRVVIGILCCLLCENTLWADVIAVKVDELFELNGIVWRLAGAEEYNSCRLESYADTVDSVFAPYKKHELIRFCNQIRNEYEIGYDAIPKITAYQVLKGDSVSFYTRDAAEKVVESDRRWTLETAERYLVLLDKFYRESEFHKFFLANNLLYEQAENELMECIGKCGNIDSSWFKNFFGEKLPDFDISVSLVGGLNNYSMLQTPRQCILLGVGGTSIGNLFNVSTLSDIVIHELIHLYANPIVDANAKPLYATLDKLYFASDTITMHYYGIGRESLPYEWLTRLFSIEYKFAHKHPIYKMNIVKEMSKGFFWMQRSFNFLQHFRNNRTEYETIYDFVPELVQFLQYSVDNMNVIKKEYSNSFPYVVEVYPLPGCKLNHSHEKVDFTIRFSHKMLTGTHGLELLCNNEEVMPEWATIEWIDDYTFLISLPTQYIKDAGFYGFILPSNCFLSEDCFVINNDITITYE